MNVYFTADTHFGHRKIIDYCDRPWSSVEEMDEGLVERWNGVVKPNDTVWHLGDVFMGDPDWELFNRLNGTIHLVAGNHDSIWPGHVKGHTHQREWLRYFESVTTFARRQLHQDEVMLSHFPYKGDADPVHDKYLQYRLPDEGKPLLCGHVHNAWRNKQKTLNVGVDVNDWTPVSIDQIMVWIDKL